MALPPGPVPPGPPGAEPGPAAGPWFCPPGPMGPIGPQGPIPGPPRWWNCCESPPPRWCQPLPPPL
ncbi:hypothetical protein CIW47_18765 [Mycolicibacterium sp. P1-5]|nr:hypothetical protein CIW47_18765 [Mycolicibacterium sp. P1-5]